GHPSARQQWPTVKTLRFQDQRCHENANQEKPDEFLERQNVRGAPKNGKPEPVGANIMSQPKRQAKQPRVEELLHLGANFSLAAQHENSLIVPTDPRFWPAELSRSRR